MNPSVLCRNGEFAAALARTVVPATILGISRLSGVSTMAADFTAAPAVDECQFEILRGTAGLALLREHWHLIAGTAGHLRFFQRHEWYESYLDSSAEAARDVCFILVRQGGSPAGVIPLRPAVRTIAGVRLRCLELVHHPLFSLSDGVFARTESNGTIIRSLIAYLRRSPLEWDVVCFVNTLEDGCVQNALRSAPPDWLISEEHTRCNYLPCLTDDELTRHLSRNFRGNLRKARNKLANLTGVEYVSARKEPHLSRALDAFLDVEASGWKGAGGDRSAIRLDVGRTNFFRALCETFSRTDACEINLLKVNGHCIAGQFCLVLGDTSYILKIGYDESFSHVAPGNLLIENSLQRYSREGVVKYVNLVSDAPWHAQWKPLSYAVSTAYVFRPALTGLAVFGLLRGKSFLRKHRPQLTAALESWRRLRRGRSRSDASNETTPVSRDARRSTQTHE